MIQCDFGLPTFPPDFLWGSASAAYQVEGAWDADGRLPSIWDTFAHTPGRVHLDQNADVSTDHYHRYHEDVDLIRWMGLKAYRFSISWSRVMDARSGQPNPAGIDFYHRLIDALLAAGIEPWITCFHWDLPQSLEDDHGGWRSRITSEKFADYCTLLSREYSDKVSHWFTINEFWNITDAGYIWGFKAPGHKVDEMTGWEVRWNALLAHGLGMQALRAAARQPLHIGLAEAVQAPIPLLPQREDHRNAALAAGRDALFLRPIFEGSFSPWDEESISRCGLHLNEADRRCVAGKLDFLGLNSYNPKYVRPADNVRGYEEIPCSVDHPKIGPDWLRIDPDILYWGPRLVHELWSPGPIYISENGCAGVEEPDGNGEVNDTHRYLQLRTHLQSAARCIADGVPLRGYFHWSTLDNFEWNDGYQHRFGLIHVDYQTLRRTPKLSAHWLREFCGTATTK